MAKAIYLFKRHSEEFSRIMETQMSVFKEKEFTQQSIEMAIKISTQLYMACIIAEAISNSLSEEA